MPPSGGGTIADTAPKLQLAGQKVPFDDRGYRWALRDAGLLADLKPSEVRLLFLIYALVDVEGFADVPTTWTAKQLGITPRSSRVARQRLERRGMIVREGDSPKYKGVGTYRLVMPQPTKSLGLSGIGSGEHKIRGGTQLPSNQEHSFPQSNTSKAKCSRQGGGDGGTGVKNAVVKDAAAPLYVRRPYCSKAAELLVTECKMSPRVAAGLVTQYGPTESQLRNILANIEARNAASEKDTTVQRVRNPAGFATSAIKRCDYTLDERVISIRQRRAALDAKAARGAKKAADSESVQVAEQELARAAERLFAGLDEVARGRLRQRAVAQMPVWQRKHHAGHPHDHPIIQAMILREHRLESHQNTTPGDANDGK